MIDFIYEDNHLLVLNKPAGLLTQPTETCKESLESLAKDWLKQKYQKPGNVFLGAIHRLDKSVSGIVVFAKTSKALSRLCLSIRKNETLKMYHALVENSPQKLTATLEHYLVHGSFLAKVVDSKKEEAKLARLHYKVLGKREGNAFLEIKLETGRYHQIRAQLAAVGSPILGDRKYGSKKSWPLQGIALHHYHFSIPHPITKELLVFEVKENWEKSDGIKGLV